MDSPQYQRSRELLAELDRRGLFGDHAIVGTCWHEHPLDRPEPGRPSRRKAYELELTPSAEADPQKVAEAVKAAQEWDFGGGKRVKVTLAPPPRPVTKVIYP